MKEAHVITAIDPAQLRMLQLDDFSRFKEKVIMIDILKSFLVQTDKATLKTIAKKEGTTLNAKSLRNALEAIVDQAIKRVEK
jgi:hypothetical protein